MFRTTLLLVWAVVCVHSATAQKAHRFALKTDVSAAFKQRVGVSGEWFWKPEKSLEIQASYEGRPISDQDYKVWTSDYAEQELFYRSASGYDSESHFVNKMALGEGIPLPPAPAFTQFWTLQLNVGHRFYFQSDQKNWRVVLQPSFSALCTAYAFNDDRVEIINHETRQHLEDGRVYTRNTVFYRQTRSTNFQKTWIPGITNEIGIMRMFKGGISVEARFLHGINFGPKPIAELATPQRFHRTYGLWKIVMGFSFG